MAKQIEIQIPQPCHEDWNNMTNEVQGGYCNSCQKTVIDFSLMSDEQLIGFFKKKPENVCGRFHTDQLNKQMLIPENKNPWLKYFFQISIPLFLLSLKTTAQNTLQRNATEIVLPKKEVTEISTAKESGVINGHVRDISGMSIAYASIIIDGTQRGTTADSNGYFSIRIRDTEKLIRISAAGYEMKKISLEANISFLDIMLDRMLMGDVVIIRTKKKLKKKKEMSPVICTQANNILVYPNPISLNSILTIKWDYAVNEKQLVEIYNTSGELIQKENLIGNKYTNSTTIQLAIKNTGNYIIRATDLKTHKFLTTQLLVN